MFSLLKRYCKKCFGRKYRIVRDNFAGYECQYRVLGFIWRQMGYCNTHTSINDALDYIHKNTGKEFIFTGINNVLKEDTFFKKINYE